MQSEKEDEALKRLDELKREEEEDLMQTLSDSYGLPYADLRSLPPEGDALRFVAKEDAIKASFAPFKIVGHSLHAGILSPEKEMTKLLIKNLETRGVNVILYLVSHASLAHVFARYDEAEMIQQVSSGEISLAQKESKELSTLLKTIDDVSRALALMRSADTAYRTTRLIETLFSGAVALSASDIHIEPEETQTRFRYRIDGVLHDISFVDDKLGKQIASRLKLLAGLKISQTKESQDGRFSLDLKDVSLEVRVSVVPGNYGESFVMRLLDPRSVVATLDTMGMSDTLYEHVERALMKPHGMILTTGPTGSGKSTTLYAFLQTVHTTENKIITIEDPVEYHLTGITQTQVDVDKNYTFLSGLRSALRQDPDIIMVGEIRDEETAQVAVNAALTGHLVFSTLHTNTSAGTIPRLLDLKVNAKVIGSALSLAIAQRLVRTLCPHCVQEMPATEKEAKIITTILGMMIVSKKENVMLGFRPALSYTLYTAPGCEYCTHGFKGRTGIYEAIVMTEGIEKLINQNPSEREIRKEADKQGIPTLKEDGILKVLQGITTLSEVARTVDLYGDE
jgi:type IV pilus assembly protein PilB